MEHRRELAVLTLIHNCRHPEPEVEALVRFAAEGRTLGDVVVQTKNNSRTFAGVARRCIPRYSPLFQPKAKPSAYVILRIGAAERFPWVREKPYRNMKTGPGPYTFRTWQEAMVGIAAHELMHCEQYKTKRPVSEVEAEWACVRALEAYRLRGV